MFTFQQWHIATFSHDVFSGSTYGSEQPARYNTLVNIVVSASGPKDEESTQKMLFLLWLLIFSYKLLYCAYAMAEEDLVQHE